MKPGPIGVFDSGYGGLTVLKEFADLLPELDYMYLGDNARTPYGTRSFETIYEYTLESVKYLFDQGCPLIILACNTASAKALRTIQQRDLPKIDSTKRILGVIRPTTEIIGNLSTTGHVGILGTSGTINSQSYLIEIKKFFPHLSVTQEACPMWVPLVENQEFENEGADFFIKQHIERLIEKDPNIDTLLLACTHYPLLLKRIKKFVPTSIKIITQGEYVARSLQDYLERHPEIANKISKTGNKTFLTTDSSDDFDTKGSLFFGKEIGSSQIHY